MGYAVVSSCYQMYSDAATASSQFAGSQVVTCTATSPFYELTNDQKLDQFVEGNLYGWAVVGAMCAAWVISYLRRAL